jgi:hypothetical protein
MIIQFDERNRIISDDLQWIVQTLPIPQPGVSRKAERWVNTAYCVDLNNAIMNMAMRKIRMIPGCIEATDGVAQICDAIDILRREIKEACYAAGVAP